MLDLAAAISLLSCTSIGNPSTSFNSASSTPVNSFDLAVPSPR